jgi:glycogen synthase
MKLLMTTDTVGGVWSYTLELCAGLAAHGVTVELASMGRRLSSQQREAVSRLPHVRLHESEYRLCWMHDPWADMERAGQWLLALETALEPDVVHLNDLGHGGLPWRSPVVLVGHSCVYSWWKAVKKQLPPPGDWRRYRAVVHASVQRADLLIAPSRAMLEALLHYYGPAHASLVIPNGRLYPPLAPGSRAGHAGWPGHASAATAFAVNSPAAGPPDSRDSAPIIFTAGRLWDEAKNIATLVDVANQLPWPVYVAGEQVEPGGTSSAGTSGVRYLGFLNRKAMAHWLRRASLYVAPAHYEPFGLGILEAARAGCGLVLGDIASLREIWADAAEYVDPADTAQLRRVITRLARNPGQCHALADRAWRRAQRYSVERMSNGYLRCYQRLMPKPRTAVHGMRQGAK